MNFTPVRRSFSARLFGLLVVLATLVSGMSAIPANAQISKAGPVLERSQEIDFGSPLTANGYVWDSDGVALEGVTVDLLYSEAHTGAATTTTDAFGYFTVTAPSAGDYKLQFYDNSVGFSEFFDNGDSFETADIISLTDDAGVYIETYIGGQTAPVGTASVDGYLVDESGDAISGGTATLLTFEGDQVTTSDTDINGYYSFDSLVAGAYTVCFSAEGYADACYGGPDFGSSSTFELVDDESLTLDDSTLTLAAGISGTVWPDYSSETGLEGIVVAAYQFDGWWSRVDETTTDIDGNYEFTALTAGSYRIVADPEVAEPTFQPEWYPNATRVSAATAVIVAAGETVLDIDFNLSDGGSISVSDYCGDVGTLCDSALIVLESLDGTLPESQRSSSDAQTIFDGLPDGRYQVSFGVSDGENFYWGGDGSQETAEIITISGGSDVTGIFHVQSTAPIPSTISGSVNLNGGGPVMVSLLADGQTEYEDYRIVDSVETDDSGAFEFIVSPGRYTIQYGEDVYEAENGNLYTGYASFLGGAYRVERATWFDLDEEENYDLGTFSAPTRNKVISGTIKNNAATPVGQAGVTVTLRGLNGTATTTTGVGGAYTISGLAPGMYSLSMEKPGLADTWAQSVQSRPSVNATGVPTSFTLNGTMAIAGASISGQITGGGVPITDESVYMLARRGSDECAVGYAAVDENGRYRIEGLPAGTYSVTAATTFTANCARWGDANVVAESNWQNLTKSITVTAAQSSSATNIANQNFALVAGGIIRGAVNGPDGEPVSSGNQVGVYGMNNEFVTYSEIADDGTYEILGLPTGSYYVEVWETSTSAPAWWNDGSSARTPIMVTAGQTASNKNLSTTVGGVLKGRIVMANGKAGMGDLQAYDSLGLEVGYFDWTNTANGDYTVSSLPQGPIRLKYTAGGQTWWIGGGTSLANAAVAYVTDGGTTNVASLALRDFGSISGDVSVAGLSENGLITLIDSSGRQVSSQTAVGGHYSFSSVVPGMYTLRYMSRNQEFVWYGNKDSLAAAAYFTVDPGAVVEGMNLNAVAATASFTPGAVTTTGTAKVGQTMSVSMGTWTPAPSAIQYRWYVDWNGAPVSTTSTYVIKPEDQGKFLRVEVVVSKSGVASDVLPISFGRVMGNAFTTTRVPTITPATTPKVGTVLTASPGAWSPVFSAVSYQWYRGTTPILGATASTYTATLDDVGAGISVRTLGTKPGYLGVYQKSSQLAATVLNTLTAPTSIVAPTVSGVKQPGGVLTAVPGTWGPAPVGLVYQWKRGSTLIPGANTATYTLTSEDVGQSITVLVTGTKVGYTPVTRTSPAVTGITAAAAKLTGATPTISGSKTVGETLTASPGTWTSGAALAYQWFRDGKTIRGANQSTYVLTPADFGSTIRVQVRGTKESFDPLVKLSAATTAIAAGTIVFDEFTFEGNLELLTGIITITSDPIDQPVKVTYQWMRDNVPVIGATKNTYMITSRDRGKTISVLITLSAKGYVTETVNYVMNLPY